MKKFLIFLLSVIMVISMFCITAFAELENVKQQNEVTSFEDNIQYGLKVKGSNILIPLFVNSNYANDFNLFQYSLDNYPDLIIKVTDSQYKLYLDDTSYLKFTSTSLYFVNNDSDDYIFGISPLSKAFYILSLYDYNGEEIRYGVSFATATQTTIDNRIITNQIFKDYINNNAVLVNSTPGFYVNLPGYIPTPQIQKDLLTVIIDTIKGFIVGIGKTFSTAFQAVFMNPTVVNGVVTYQGLNSLSIMLLSISGMTLGYGIIRWITGLFRKES